MRKPSIASLFKGRSPEDVARVLAILDRPLPRASILQAEDAYTALAPLLLGYKEERLAILFLDRKKRPITREILTIGTDCLTIFCPRDICRRALEVRAHSIIVAHNHPSGDTSPSDSDIEVTRRLAAACKTVDIPLDDHLIIGGEDSFLALARRMVW